jgi:hypothetical protein
VTTRTAYSDDEWHTLSKLPQTVAVAVIASGASGPIQLMRELAALKAALSDTRQQPPSNELVTAVATAEADAPVESVPPDGSSPARSDTEADGPPAPGDLSTAEGQRSLRDEALDRCTMAMAILAAKSPADEADGFKRWVMAIARKVAQSAKEGSFLGIGGTPISEEEEETLAKLAAALEIAPTPAL